MENRTTITITLFGEDSSFSRRRRVRDAVASALEQAQLGAYVGGGTMVTDEPHYNVEYEVTDEGLSLALMRDTLRSLAVGSATELSIGGDRRYNVYDDSWTDLGSRVPTCLGAAEPTAVAGVAPDSSVSSQDFLAQLQHLADEARRKYGGPKDPNRGA